MAAKSTSLLVPFRWMVGIRSSSVMQSSVWLSPVSSSVGAVVLIARRGTAPVEPEVDEVEAEAEGICLLAEVGPDAVLIADGIPVFRPLLVFPHPRGAHAYLVQQFIESDLALHHTSCMVGRSQILLVAKQALAIVGNSG